MLESKMFHMFLHSYTQLKKVMHLNSQKPKSLQTLKLARCWSIGLHWRPWWNLGIQVPYSEQDSNSTSAMSTGSNLFLSGVVSLRAGIARLAYSADFQKSVAAGCSWLQQIQDTAARWCEPLWSWGLVPGQRSWNLILCQHWGTLQQGTERNCYICLGRQAYKTSLYLWSQVAGTLHGQSGLAVSLEDLRSSHTWEEITSAGLAKAEENSQATGFMGGTMEHFNICQYDRTINGSKWFNHSTCTSWSPAPAFWVDCLECQCSK